MSFILNALRKSEQERQSLQPEAVTDRILIDHSEQKQSKSAFFYVVLVVGNILLITAVAWLVHKNLTSSTEVVKVATQSQATPEVVIKSEPMVTPVPHEVVVAPPAPLAAPAPVILPAQQAIEIKPQSEPVINQVKQVEPPNPEPVIKSLQSDSDVAQPNTTSIAEWVESQTLKTEDLPVKPVIKNKSENEAVKPATKVNVSSTSKSVAPVVPVIKKNVKVEPGLPDVRVVRNDIPFLSELPYDVRRSIPKLTINVFVYSDDPQESFVMIDMVKVKTGQTIQEGMVLKEIRPDSLVVDYQGRTFQIARS